MARFKLLIGSLLAALSFSGHAAYVNMKPPPGWSQGGSAVSSVGQGLFTSANAAAATSIILGRIGANAALTVAGSEAAIPVALRLGAGAATVAANLAYTNPYILGFTALSVAAPIAYNWFTEQGFTFDQQENAWKKDEKQMSLFFNVPPLTEWYPSKASLCAAWLSKVGHSYDAATTAVVYGTTQCAESYQGQQGPSSGWKVSQGITEKTMEGTKLVPVALPEFVAKMAPLKVPAPMFREYPGYVEWPVDLPYIDPETGEESTSFGRPFLVPTGLPVLNPDGLSWNQPAVRVTPAPTPSAPWRVDVAPVNVPQATGTPKTADQLNPKTVTTIDPVTGEPVVIKPDTGTPTTDKPTPLCEQYPDILACQKLGESDVPDLETKSPTVSITPDSGWTFGSGSCPAPRHLIGPNIDFEFTPYCDFLSGIKPVLIAAAWILAGFILFGFKGSEE